MGTKEIIIAVLFIIAFFYCLNIILKDNPLEHFYQRCFGNVYCDGDQDICVDEKCLPCGIRKPCKEDADCGPSICNNGCCEGI